MTQNLGDEKVLAIPALFACYETKPNALACARNEKVACSSQVTSSMKTPGFPVKPGVFATFWTMENWLLLRLGTIWVLKRNFFIFRRVSPVHFPECPLTFYPWILRSAYRYSRKAVHWLALPLCNYIIQYRVRYIEMGYCINQLYPICAFSILCTI